MNYGVGAMSVQNAVCVLYYIKYALEFCLLKEGIDSWVFCPSLKSVF